MTYYVIYENPLDYPGKFVLRQHMDIYTKDATLLVAAIDPDAVEDTLAAARHRLPANVFCIGRQPEDDWSIKEVWI